MDYILPIWDVWESGDIRTTEKIEALDEELAAEEYGRKFDDCEREMAYSEGGQTLVVCVREHNTEDVPVIFKITGHIEYKYFAKKADR